MAAAYPDLMSVETVGYSVQSRELFLVKLSNNVSVNQAKPAFFYEGTIHGDELAGYILALKTIAWLVTGYGSDPDATTALDTMELFFEPLTNPDGNYDDPLWGPQRYNANGVDVNRNFGFMWDQNASPWPGDGPHSEPEAQAVGNIWMRSQPFSMGISGHGGAVLFLYPWGYRGGTTENNAEYSYLGDEYIYPGHCLDPDMDMYGSIYNVLYQAQGVSGDEFYGAYGSLGIVFELSYDKQCAYSKSVEIFEDNKPGLIWLWSELRNGLHGTVTDADTGDPIGAVIDVDGKWFTISDWEVGDFHKYLRAGTYDVRVFANGYNDYNGQVTIANGAPTNLDVELTAADVPATYAFRWILSEMPTSYDTTAPPTNALGAPDGDWISLGNGGYVVLDLGPDGIVNQDGADIAVYEAGSDGDESFALYGSTGDAHGPWTLIGEGSGSASFDLNGVMSSVRWVKVIDTADEVDDKGNPNAGYDLDAVGSPSYFAAFTGDPTYGQRPLTVEFTDRSSGSPTSWLWDFGDGDTSTEQNPTHVYQDLGTYDVSLSIDGPGGPLTLAKQDYINVVELPPVAEFVGSPTSGQAPLEVDFTNQSAGTIDTYAWTFGDGGTSANENPSHTYDGQGNFTVKLTVTGPGGSDTRQRLWYIHVQGTTDDDDDDNDDNDTADDDTADDDTTDDDAADDDDDDNDDNDDDNDSDDDDNDDNDNGGDDDDDSGCGC
jgi:PKD repeat protein